MKTLGLIGGMSWESTVSYYQAINRGVNQRLGGLHSAKLLLSSVDFAQIEHLQHKGDWALLGRLLSHEALNLENAGADAILICTNTMHKVAEEVESALSIPLLHIADATGYQLQRHQITKVGLLGTQFTMEQNFYIGRLEDKFGIDVIVPDPPQRSLIHNIIYEQLCKGVICTESRKAYIDIINSLAMQGAQWVILGCTEIALLVQQTHTSVRLFDTTTIHAEAAVHFALE
ncbi:aspartate/glutamate racemase family protein [Alteromonas sp. D210916BOD_24]|uniref:aspartate/glutamate racemase family protein n=1 Tax=Alteromonas sp. D210916BOD_24 TaxID=3157618 RepID=UPI00399D0710